VKPADEPDNLVESLLQKKQDKKAKETAGDKSAKAEGKTEHPGKNWTKAQRKTYNASLREAGIDPAIANNANHPKSKTYTDITAAHKLSNDRLAEIRQEKHAAKQKSSQAISKSGNKPNNKPINKPNNKPDTRNQSPGRSHGGYRNKSPSHSYNEHKGKRANQYPQKQYDKRPRRDSYGQGNDSYNRGGRGRSYPDPYDSAYSGGFVDNRGNMNQEGGGFGGMGNQYMDNSYNPAGGSYMNQEPVQGGMGGRGEEAGALNLLFNLSKMLKSGAADQMLGGQGGFNQGQGGMGGYSGQDYGNQGSGGGYGY